MTSLTELRAEIDDLDRRLIPLLSRRFAVTDEVAAAKAATGHPVFDPAREQLIMDKLANMVDGDRRSAVEAVYHSIMDESKRRQSVFLASSVKS